MIEKKIKLLQSRFGNLVKITVIVINFYTKDEMCTAFSEILEKNSNWILTNVKENEQVLDQKSKFLSLRIFVLCVGSFWMYSDFHFYVHASTLNIT